MLWGDEVRPAKSARLGREDAEESEANRFQVEYLVVNYSPDDPKVLLSLRQAEILTALAADKDLAEKGGCVPELQHQLPKKPQ